MSTPIEILLDRTSLIIFGIYGLLILWEFFAPGRELPDVKGWRFKGIFFFLIFFYISTYLPLIWDKYLIKFQVFNLNELGTVWGGILGAVIYEFLVYWWHRSMHTFTPLWLMFHQLHHSAERIDTYGAYYFSLNDMVGWTILQSLSLVVIIGITPPAATLAIIITTFLGIFQHTNVKTPQWLGYIFQRPESHSIHHGKNIHKYNYSDLPIFDIIFGTFRNPETFVEETGFYPGASSKIWEMLAFKDIYKKIK